MQYVTTETPLGKESYGLMMLVNVLVPALEHGVRPDWKAILPPAAIMQSGQWANNFLIHMRSHAPSVFALLLVRPSSFCASVLGKVAVCLAR